MLQLAPIARAQDSSVPMLSGVITRSMTSGELDVNGKRVICTEKTTVGAKTGDQTNCQMSSLYVGEPVKVFGTEDYKAHAIRAEWIMISQPSDEREGLAVIDRVLGEPAAGQLMVRADGYPILLRVADTKMRFSAPLKAIGDVCTNVWIDYRGHQRADGVVVADAALFFQNFIEDREKKLRENSEYDPAAVPATAHQSAASRAFIGVKVTEIPPYADAAMQARVDRIGKSLVPAYQKALPDTDLGKI